MSNNLRFRSGQVELRKFKVDSATVLEAGDLVYLASNKVKPAHDFTWHTNLATTQGEFADVFVGVVHEKSAAGDTDDVSVDFSPHSVYEMDVASAAYEIGDELGPDEASSHLMSQQLEAVATGTLGVARAAEHKPAGSTTLRVTFAFSTGSASSNAAMG